MLKLQTSEQMPLMWKPGETQITTIHHGFNIVRLQEQHNMVWCFQVFLNASHNFKALSINEF